MRNLRKSYTSSGENANRPPVHLESCYRGRVPGMSSARGLFSGVIHIVLGGPYESGRLVREEGDPLCRQRHHLPELAGPGGAYKRPTCRMCLALAKRHGFLDDEGRLL